MGHDRQASRKWGFSKLSPQFGPDRYILRSFTCPIAAAVRIEPCACQGLAALFEQLTGRPTRETCLRGEKLVCQFEIEK